MDKQTSLGIVVLAVSAASAFPLAAQGAGAGLDLQTGQRFDLQLGQRLDNLDWNIAGSSANVVSELSWRDLNITQLRIASESDLPGGWRIKSSASYGWILRGRNQDSDYLYDNRQGEYSRSNNDTTGDSVADVSIGAGYPLLFGEPGERIEISPQAGYSYHAQNLRMQNGLQTIPATGPFPGLNSTFQAQWSGPWIGLGIATPPGEHWQLLGQVQHHWATYSADAYWNLRPLRFEQSADGSGDTISLGLLYRFRKHWMAQFNLNYQSWSTSPGTITFYDGTVTRQPLNEVNWDSRGADIGLRYLF